MSKIRKDVDATADSYPYVTGMGFRNRAHMIFDEFHQEPAGKIKADGDVVFIKTDYVATFFNDQMPHIKHNIKIITHNSALGIDYRYLPFLNHHRIIKWYAQNANFEHSRLTSVPLGLSNSRWLHGNVEDVKEVVADDTSKQHLVHMNFDLSTNPEKRTPVFDRFVNQDYVLHTDPKPFKEYLYDLKGCKYTLSPPGAGNDCHRTWEAIIVGTIPIIEKTHNMSFYEGLPVLMVDDWSNVTLDLLEEKYEEIIDKKNNTSYTELQHWVEEIGLLPEPRSAPAGVIIPPGCELA
jgi:hypothetical protein